MIFNKFKDPFTLFAKKYVKLNFQCHYCANALIIQTPLVYGMYTEMLNDNSSKLSEKIIWIMKNDEFI